MPRQGCYVDNAANRALGRVGMAYGTAVDSRSSGSRMSVASTASSSPRVYVDNTYNRAHGRVGMEHGTAIVSRSSGSRNSSSYSDEAPRTYVDNSYNRAHGRVGMELGTASISRSSGSRNSSSFSSKPTPTYLDDSYDQVQSRARSPPTIAHSPPSPRRQAKKTYVDNAYNRRLGRVGKELGTHVVSKSDSTYLTPKVYADNAMNRRLGRVGEEFGSTSQGATKFQTIITRNPMYCSGDAYQELDMRRQAAIEKYDAETVYMCDRIEGVFNRQNVAKSIKRKPLPPWLKSGEVIDFRADLVIGDKLGNGGFGDVHVAVWKGEVDCCVKVLRVQKVHPKKKKEFQDEVKQLSSLSHPAVVKFYGACIETPNLAIVMEFMRSGSLSDAIHITSTQFDDFTKFQLSNDMLSALKYIHGIDVVHRDIKSSNVLLCDDQNHCKLADFGLALREEVETTLSVADHSIVGTVKYSPFEVLEGERLTVEQFKAVDVYSTAVTILELMTERMPFDKMNQHQIRRALRDGDIRDLELIDNQLLKDLLTRCLDKRSTNRPSAEEFSELLTISRFW